MKQPNILLISIDTLRADHLSCYGYHRETTPNIDSIAREGIRFTKAYSTAVWTPPAHASMLTGLYPSQHGVVDNRKLSKHIPTIAEVLSKHGYSTAGFVNNPQVGAFVGLDKGHQSFFEVWKGITSKNLLVRGTHFLYRSLLTLLGVIDQGAKKTNSLVKAWLKSRVNDERPFYMFVHYIEPHNPIKAPRPHKKKFLAPGCKNIDRKKLRAVADNPLICFTDNFELNEREIEYLISLYDGEVEYVDAIVGDLTNIFRKLDLLDDTVVIITADHGEHFGEHGLYSHVSSLYEPIVHVPLIIRYPKFFKPSDVCEYPVQHVDILPTVLEILQNKDNSFDKLPGKSLVSRNGNLEINKPRAVFAEWEGRIPEFVKSRVTSSKNSNCLFTKKLKMILEENDKYILSENGDEEFYKLDNDPDELKNLASTEQERCGELKQILTQTINLDSSTEESQECEMDELVKQRLRGLGYI